MGRNAAPSAGRGRAFQARYRKEEQFSSAYAERQGLGGTGRRRVWGGCAHRRDLVKAEGGRRKAEGWKGRRGTRNADCRLAIDEWRKEAGRQSVVFIRAARVSSSAATGLLDLGLMGSRDEGRGARGGERMKDEGGRSEWGLGNKKAGTSPGWRRAMVSAVVLLKFRISDFCRQRGIRFWFQWEMWVGF